MGFTKGICLLAILVECFLKIYGIELYVTHSAGFQHGVLPLSESLLREIGETSRAFEVTVARDSSAVNHENLRGYDAIVFYTSGELPLSDGQKESLLDFIRSGKGFAGIHSASDTLYNWPEYGELLGVILTATPGTRM